MNTKLETQLKWKADENFETGVVKTVDWYLEKYRGIQSEYVKTNWKNERII